MDANTNMSRPPYVQEVARINQLNSPFLRLPAELRNEIYEYYFSDSIAIIKKPRGDNGASYKNYCDNTDPLNLLGTCLQISHEASPLFWRLATFGVPHDTTIEEIESLLGRPKCALITKVCQEAIHTNRFPPSRDRKDLFSPVVGVFPFRVLRSVCIVLRHVPSSILEEFMNNLLRWKFGTVEVNFAEDKNLDLWVRAYFTYYA